MPPTDETIVGEAPGIWTFLGTDRLAAPIAEHEPDLVLHGHAHAGTFQGAISEVPVYNVSVPVMQRDSGCSSSTPPSRRGLRSVRRYIGSNTSPSTICFTFSRSRLVRVWRGRQRCPGSSHAGLPRKRRRQPGWCGGLCAAPVSIPGRFRAEEIAARTVNKERARAGESRTRSRTSTQVLRRAAFELAVLDVLVWRARFVPSLTPRGGSANLLVLNVNSRACPTRPPSGETAANPGSA